VLACADGEAARAEQAIGMLNSHQDHIRVKDVMHPGILTCWTDAPLGEVAAIMAKHRVHAVAVMQSGERHPVGIVSDLDLVAAANGAEEPTAGQAAGTEPLSISASEGLGRAAQLMTEHGVSHLVVRDPAGGFPVGIVSTLDLAAYYGDGQDR
jgi:CBS domain-containing protein